LRLLPALILCVSFFFTSAVAADLVRDHVLSFPHVVAGNVGGQYVESVLLIANPTNESIHVEVFSTPDSLARKSIVMAPLTTEEIRISGDEYTAGWVQVSSANQFAADLTIVIKSSQSADQIVARVDVPGQVPSSRVITPIRVRSPLASDTGLALALNVPAAPGQNLRFVLHDATGSLVADKSLAPRYYIAQFVTEIFGDLPEEFTSGWLSVELVNTSGQLAEQPMALSLMSIYMVAAEYLTAGATGMDIPAQYTVALESAGDNQVTELMNLYNFELVHHTEGSELFTAKMTRELARALARDDRVERVTPAAYIPAG